MLKLNFGASKKLQTGADKPKPVGLRKPAEEPRRISGEDGSPQRDLWAGLGEGGHGRCGGHDHALLLHSHAHQPAALLVLGREEVKLHQSPDRDNPVQGLWGQIVGRPLWGHHLRRLQGLLQEVAVLRRQLPVSPAEELRRGPREPQPMSVLPITEVPSPRHVQGCGEIRAHEQKATGKSGGRGPVPQVADAKYARRGDLSGLVHIRTSNAHFLQYIPTHVQHVCASGHHPILDHWLHVHSPNLHAEYSH